MSGRTTIRFARRAAVLGLALILAACAAKPEQTESNAVFYPDPPAPPRIQFLTSISDGQHTTAKSDSSFAEWIVGEDPRAKSSTEFASPYGVAIYNKKLYICDVALNRVHILDLATQQYSILQPDDRIRNPVNLTVDRDGTKYLCDTFLRKILVFDPNDRLVSEIGQHSAWTPIDLAIRGDELFVTDTTGGKIEVYAKSGEHLRTISEKGLGPDQLTNPTNLAISDEGRLYVVDTFLQVVKVFDPDNGNFMGLIGGPGTNVGSFARPKGIALDPKGNLYVTDAQWDVVQAFGPDGQLLMSFGAPGKHPWSMGLPAGILVDQSTVEIFKPYFEKNFQPQYLVFVVNQFGKHKIGVFAYGRDTSLPASAYEIDVEAVEQRRAELRKEAERKEAERKRPTFVQPE